MKITVSSRRALLWVSAVAVVLLVAGCSFTARDAIDLEHASTQSAAASNMRELMEYFRNGPRERVTSAYAWRSGVALATRHGLANFDPVLYDQFYETLAAGEGDTELRAWKYYCLAILRDPRCVEILIRELATLRPSSPQDWECAVNALYAVMEMPGLIEGNASARMEFLQGLSRLRTIAAGTGSRTPSVATFLAYAQTFEERFKNPVVLAELLHRVEPSTPDDSIMDYLRQANDLLVDAASPRPKGSYRQAELLALADAMGLLALREGRGGDRAWVMLMEYAPIHGAMAILDQLDARGGAPAAAGGVAARRAVDTLATLRVLRDVSAAPSTGRLYVSHSNGLVLDPREQARGFDAAQLMERLTRLAVGLMSGLQGDDLWLAAVQHLVRFERGLAVTQLVSVGEQYLQVPDRARLYARTMANLLAEGGSDADAWRKRAADRLPSLVRIAAHRVPSIVLRAIGTTHAAEIATELQAVMESRGPPRGADQAMWDEWYLTYCNILGRLDGGSLSDNESAARVSLAAYSAMSRHLVRSSMSVQLGVIEFLRRRDANLACQTVLDARKSTSQGDRAALDAALGRLLSSREVTDVRVLGDAVAEMLILARDTDENQALVGARALVENASESARAAVRQAIAAGTHSGQAVRLVFKQAAGKWQGGR